MDDVEDLGLLHPDARERGDGEEAAELGVSREAVVLAWLLRLPWGVRPVIGTQDPERVAACAEAAAAAEAMDSAQWHRLWTAARGRPLP